MERGLGKHPLRRGKSSGGHETPLAAILKAVAGKGFSDGNFGGEVQVLLMVWERGKAAAQEQPRVAHPCTPWHHRGAGPLRAGPWPWGILLLHDQAFPLGVIRDNYYCISPAASLQEVMQH